MLRHKEKDISVCKVAFPARYFVFVTVSWRFFSFEVFETEFSSFTDYFPFSSFWDWFSTNRLLKWFENLCLLSYWFYMKITYYTDSVFCDTVLSIYFFSDFMFETEFSFCYSLFPFFTFLKLAFYPHRVNTCIAKEQCYCLTC